MVVKFEQEREDLDYEMKKIKEDKNELENRIEMMETERK